MRVSAFSSDAILRLGGYGPSQDEMPWGRGLRALLDCDCGVHWTPHHTEEA